MTAQLATFPDSMRIARKVRGIFLAVVRRALGGYPEDFAGFALVQWDKRGNCYTAYYCDTGPIGERMLPSFIHDVLQQHVSTVLIDKASLSHIGPEPGA